jgi:hypothetical protein
LVVLENVLGLLWIGFLKVSEVFLLVVRLRHIVILFLHVRHSSLPRRLLCLEPFLGRTTTTLDINDLFPGLRDLFFDRNDLIVNINAAVLGLLGLDPSPSLCELLADVAVAGL